MATLDVSTYYGDPSHFLVPNPDYATLLAGVAPAGGGGAVGGLGSGATTNGPDTARGVVNATTNSPLVVVFTIQGEENYIHVGHSLSVYPQDLGMPTAFDNKVIALVGNDLASAVPIVFPADSWTRTAAFRASTQAIITGPTMYGAGPPAVLRSGPHAGGAADTDEIRVRRTLILPPTASVAVLAGICNGTLHPERLLQHSHRPHCGRRRGSRCCPVGASGGVVEGSLD